MLLKALHTPTVFSVTLALRKVHKANKNDVICPALTEATKVKGE